MTGKDIIKIALNLIVIYVIGGLLLAWVYSTASPIMYKKGMEEKAAALKAMMPGAGTPQQIGEWSPEHHHAAFYEVKSGEKLDGYIIETFGKGYSSFVHIFVAMAEDMKIKKIKILHQAETPGLGDEIEADWFTKQYEGKGLDRLVVVKGDPNTDKIQAITGATISTRAVTNGVKAAVEMMIKRNEGLLNSPAGLQNTPMQNTPAHEGAH